jgi:hypothetical protein
MNLQRDKLLAKQQFWQGGATVGERNFCFWAAELDVTRGKIFLKLASLERYAFEPRDVRKIEIHECKSPGVLPAIAIQIHHTVRDFPEQVAFLVFCHDSEPYKQWLWEMGFEVAK